jgi:hypothetical protein
MKHWKWGISVVGLMAMTAQVSAATLRDQTASAALKTAAVQQELMVAGLTCHAGQAYNRFVIADRPDLQKSDADLMAYFKSRDGNEAGYDSYKTKLANLASNKSSAYGSRFCSDTARAFRASEGASLKDFVAGHRLLIAAPESCAVKYDRVEEASVSGPSYALPAAPYGAPPPARRYAEQNQRNWRQYADASDTSSQTYVDSYAQATDRYSQLDRRDDYVPPPPPRRQPRREQDYYQQGWTNGPYAWLPPPRRWRDDY